MPTAGNFSVAAKRTALADRNVAMKDKRDTLYDSKSGTTRNHNTTSTMVATTAQENRTQGNPKNVLKTGLSQPAQRPKTVVPSASMSQLKSGSNDTHSRPKLPARASIANFVNFVYSDLQQGKPKPAPAEYSKTAHEDLPQAKPSYTSTSIKQEPLIDLTCIEPEVSQAAQYQPRDQQSSRSSKYGEAHNQKPSYSFTQSSLLPVGEAPSPDPSHPEGDVTESLYVDAVEDLTQEQIQFLTNAPGQFLVPPTWSETLPNHPAEPHDPRVADRTNSTSVVPEDHHAECRPETQPPGLVDDHPCSSDYDEEEDYRYDEPASNTVHSNPSRGDNTTGGVTTVMLPPKLTEKGLAELEAAKRIVESRRTPDEIQEDAWDVSMVAEYGDEIFHYMKHQEVRYSSVMARRVSC